MAATEPDFIILLDYQTGSDADALRHFLENHPLMKLTPGPANVDAVEKLARAMYPSTAK